MSRIYHYWKLLRPRHWVKNLLIFAPFIFGGDITDYRSLLSGGHLFLSFSLLASSVYILNDLVDKNYDKLHPQKRSRPIASGHVSVREAIILGISLLLITFAISYSLPLDVLIVLGIYLALNLLYSFWLKHIVIVDIFLVASLYLVRIFAGGNLWDIPISHWLVLCTFFLALFLISAKRRSEFCNMGGTKASTRKIMESYNKDFLDHMLTITTTASLVTYSLYVISVDKPYHFYSIFLVAFGFFRYLYLVYRYNVGQSPESVLFTDLWIILAVISWALYTASIFYLF
jgi:4-hydroxybenzoate polyprenyltransferase